MANIRWSAYVVSTIVALTVIPSLAAGDPPADACDIQGIVVDDAFIPLAGASLGVLGTEPFLQTDSGPDGSFLFAAVAPGDYNVIGAKIGFELGVVDAPCVAGEVTELTLVLSPIPPPPAPFVVIYAPLSGQIGCSIGAYSISTADVCTQTGLTPDGKTRFDLPTNAGDVTGAVYELEWAPTTALSDCLSLTYPQVAAQNPAYTTDDHHFPVGAIVSGQSPLQLKIEGSVGDPLHLFEGDEQIVFQVRAPGSTQGQILADPLDPCNVNVVVDQTFTLFVALFYNGAPIPPGFTMLPA